MASPPNPPRSVYNPLTKYEGIRHSDKNALKYLKLAGLTNNNVSQINDYTRSNYSRAAFTARLETYIRSSPVPMKATNLWKQANRHVSSALFDTLDPEKLTHYSDLSSIPFVGSSSAGPGYPGKLKEEVIDLAIQEATNIMNQWPEPHSIPDSYFADVSIPIFPRSAPSKVTMPKARPVFMDYFPFILIESAIALPIYEHLKMISSLPKPPVLYGQDLNRLAAVITSFAPRFDLSTGRMLCTTEADFKSFDRLLAEPETRQAIEDYYKHLPNPTKLEEYAYKFILRRNKAPFTVAFETNTYNTYDISLTGRILTTYFATHASFTRHTYLHLYFTNDYKIIYAPQSIICLGDDSLIQSQAAQLYSSVAIKRAFKKVFPADHPVIEITQRTSAQEVTFLGHTISGRKINRSAKEIISLAIFPENPIDCSDPAALTYLRLTGIAADCGHQVVLVNDAIKLMITHEADLQSRILALQDLYNRKFCKPDFILQL